MPDYSTTRIQLRRGTSAEWNTASAAGKALAKGEPGYDTSSGVLKIGDGTQTWNQLAAISGVGGGGSGSSTFAGLSDTPANFTSAGSKFVKVNSGASALEFVAASPLENVVEDTTPQLGGALHLNGNNIVGTGNINVFGSGTFKSVDGQCGLMVLDRGLSGVHIGDCALGTVPAYAGMKHSNHGASDYMIISNGVTTFLSAVNNGAVIIRGGGNDSANEIQVKDVGAGVAGIIFNEGGADRDIRMEGDTEQNLFYVDASTNRIGIGTATPNATLHVSGTMNATVVTQNSKTVPNADATGITGASGIANIVVMHSGAYAALGSKDASTIYFVQQGN